MGVDPPGDQGAATGPRLSQALAWSLVLGLLVVVAAAIGGPARFGGPRWLPHVRSAPPSRVPPLAQATGRSGGPIPEWIPVTVLAIIAAVIVVVLIRLLKGRWPGWRLRRRQPASASPLIVSGMRRLDADPGPDAPAVQTGIELALEVLGEQREPADAVVRAWLGLQETAESSGVGRRPAETPTEFTSRILRRVVSDDAPVQTLLRLYLRTRFGDHPVSAGDVAEVRAALASLVTTWPRRTRVPR